MLNKNIFAAVLIYIALATAAHADNEGVILKIKNNRLVIQMPSTEFSDEKYYYSIDQAKKPVALLKVIKVQGDKVFCEIMKGTPLVGQLVTRTNREKNTAAAESPAPTPRFVENHHFISLQYSSAAMTVTETDLDSNQEKVKLTGSGLKAAYFYENNLFKTNFRYQLSAGVVMYNLSGDATGYVCDLQTSTTCTFKTSYLDLGVALKSNFYESNRSAFYYKAGFDIEVPMKKESTAFLVDDIKNLYAIGAALGVTLKMNNHQFPIELGYTFHPISADVKFSDIRLSIAYSL